MFFAVLTFLAAFSIEAIGTVVSVIGLSTLFGANPIIMTLAVALDVGKLVVVSLLYKYWKQLNGLMKAYGLIAAVVTMTITSAGAAGYLSGEFQKAILGTQEVGLKVEVLKEEQAKLEARKKQIDDQIANLPSNYSRSRITLMKQFEDEQKTITARLQKIQEELPQQQLAQIGTEAKAGPILYIAKAFDVPVEEAVKWVILMIIFVFDPLAVFLIVAGNFLWDQYQSRKPKKDGPSSPSGPTTPPPDDGPPEVKVIPAGPDASQAKVYTRDDLIAGGASNEALVNAGYEPEPPIFEVLEPTPVPTPAPQPERITSADVSFRDPTPSDGGEVPLKREEITKSTLGVVKPDPKTIVDTGEIGYRTGVYRSGQSH